MKNNFVQLGTLIEEIKIQLGDESGVEISGIKLEEGFMPTVANMTGINTSRYKVVPPNSFACNLMHIGRDVAIPIAHNDSKEIVAVSPAYYVFQIKDEAKKNVLSTYLSMLFSREEFGRITWFYTDSSIRGNLIEAAFHGIKIPLPSIEVQQELVNTYNGLKKLAEQNEALIEPLAEACQAYIVDCKNKHPEVELGGYIESVDERNSSGKYTVEDVRGLSNSKILIQTKANMQGVSLTPYKLLGSKEFAYVTVTSRNGNKLSLAMNGFNETSIVSSSYEVFRCVNMNVLLPEYLFLIINREEFDRYSRFNSWGSARETFDWDELCRVRIPLPSLEVQQAIVNLYRCAEEARNIANQAREQMKTLVSALVQKAINS